VCRVHAVSCACRVLRRMKEGERKILEAYKQAVAEQEMAIRYTYWRQAGYVVLGRWSVLLLGVALGAKHSSF
jgi:hypothetical protein